MEKPLIGDYLKEWLGLSNSDSNNSSNNAINNPDNQVQNIYHTVTFEILANANNPYGTSSSSMLDAKSYVTDYGSAFVAIKHYTDDQTFIEDIDKEYSPLINDSSNQNVQVSDLLTITVGNYTFNYKSISYQTSTGTIAQRINLWYRLNDEYIYMVELKALSATISDDDIMPFLNIQVQ